MSQPNVKLEFHGAAKIFPLDEENLDELAQDIKQHGLKVPIETLGNQIIDGRRRSLACARVGVDPIYRCVEVDDPIAYVISLNIHRRHMTPSERALAGARARHLYDQQAKERQKIRKGNQAGTTPVNLPELCKGDTRDQVGEAFGVSGKLVDYATRVLERAVPEVVQAVEQGRMSVRTAALLATEPEEAQRTEAKRTRRYHSVSKPLEPEAEKSAQCEEDDSLPTVKGVGVIRAQEAINILAKIPKNDGLRKRGFQVVTDWIKRNQ